MRTIGIFMTENNEEDEPDDVLGRIEGAEGLPMMGLNIGSAKTFRNTREATNVT